MLGLIFFLGFMTSVGGEMRVNEKILDSHRQILAIFSTNTASGYVVAALIEVGSRQVPNLTFYVTNLVCAPNVPKIEQCRPNSSGKLAGHERIYVEWVLYVSLSSQYLIWLDPEIGSSQ